MTNDTGFLLCLNIKVSLAKTALATYFHMYQKNNPEFLVIHLNHELNMLCLHFHTLNDYMMMVMMVVK